MEESNQNNMSYGGPVTYKDFDCNKLSVSQIKVTPRQARVAWVNYDNGNKVGPVYLQTPFNLRAPMGITKWENDGQPPSYEVLLSLSGSEGELFAKKLEEFDTWVKNKAMERSREWLKKTIDNIVVIETLYNPSLRLPRDKDTGEITDKFPPSFRAKIPMSPTGKPECEVYEYINGSPVLVDLLDLMERKSLKGASMTAIVKCTGIWFPQKFSVSWQIQQLLIEPNAMSLKPCAFVGMQSAGFGASSPNTEPVGDDDYFNAYPNTEPLEEHIE